MIIAEEVKQVIAKALRVPIARLQDNTNLKDLGADSIDLIEAMFQLEEKFDIDLTVKIAPPARSGTSRHSQEQMNLDELWTVSGICGAVSAIVAAKKSR
jgi:acyl carrier protein